MLVNNAGAGQVGAAEEITDSQLRDMLDQHLFGPAAYVRAVLLHMRGRGSGAIVQMSSQGGCMSFPAVGSNSAGKFALEGWSEALAGEAAPFGIKVAGAVRANMNNAVSLSSGWSGTGWPGWRRPARARDSNEAPYGSRTVGPKI